MTTSETATGLILKLERTFNRPCGEVYRAWTDANALSQWFVPSSEFEVRVAELDVREGGHYRIEMHSPDGNTYTVAGDYVEVIPSLKLVMTWAWENSDPPDEMLVTVEFTENGNGTALTLMHEKLLNRESRDQHEEGWFGCLASLETYLKP